MAKIKNLLDFSHYLFVFAHPDDEIYTCVIISELIKKCKIVDILYVTSGDYNGADIAIEREKEVFESMNVIGVKKEKVHFIRMPERELMNKVPELCNELVIRLQQLKPDCVVSHDFEGGHNMHDAVSFAVSHVTQKINLPLFVFPAYHGWPEKRLWNEFVAGRKEDYALAFTNKQKQMQKNVILAHQTQQTFFGGIKKSSSKNIFSEREILRYISDRIDYTLPPDNPVGYEYPGSKIKFEDFKNIVSLIS